MSEITVRGDIKSMDNFCLNIFDRKDFLSQFVMVVFRILGTALLFQRCARLEQWSYVDEWLQLMKTVNKRDVMFFNLLALANRLECQLLCLCHSCQSQDDKLSAKLQKQIVKVKTVSRIS